MFVSPHTLTSEWVVLTNARVFNNNEVHNNEIHNNDMYPILDTHEKGWRGGEITTPINTK